MNHLHALIDFFNVTVPRLTELYKWNIPNRAGFEVIAGDSNYHSNIRLKIHLHQSWLNSGSSIGFEKKIEISNFVVRDWGGVRGNKPETLFGYIEALERGNPPTPIKGVASYSKIYSIASPDKYAIYDARVAACLNAVQFNYEVECGIAFNYIPGRNNVVGNAIRRTGFSYIPAFSVDSLSGRGWRKLAKNETYGVYNEILSECLNRLPSYNRFELEMSLFACAEEQCLKAIENLRSYSTPS